MFLVLLNYFYTKQDDNEFNFILIRYQSKGHKSVSFKIS